MAASHKVALVTGAGTGIGKAVALALMREGYAVTLAGRRADKLEETAAEGTSTNGKSLVMPTDGMWRGALYYLQTPQLLAVQALAGRRAAANPFFAANPPGVPYLLWTAGWVIGLLGLAILSFRRKEL